MTRINNKQSDLTQDEFLRMFDYNRIIKKHRESEKPKTKEMRAKYLGDLK